MICHQCRGWKCSQCKGAGEKMPDPPSAEDLRGAEFAVSPEEILDGKFEPKPIECKVCGGTGRVGVMHGACKKRNEGKVPRDCDCQHREPDPRPGVLLTK